MVDTIEVSLHLTQAHEWLIWVTGGLLLAWISRRSLSNRRSHGFYRYFAFIATLGVVVPNLRYWHDQLSAHHQLASWLLLFTALGLLVSSLGMLIAKGGRRERPQQRENFAFENTAQLVDTGIYRYIRHPMYSSLMLFTWGAWLKHVSWLGLALAIISTIALWLTARVEEAENELVFGEAYRHYSQRTHRFIPFLL